jgi:hypothetical protein
MDSIIEAHFADLQRRFPTLKLFQDPAGTWVVEGDLHFSASYEKVGATIKDCFRIRLVFPVDYPDSPPTVREVGGRIPNDFHTNLDGTLCLGAPLIVLMKFMESPTLLRFVETQIVEFLYAFRYQEDFGALPYGELSHGGRGLLESYSKLFGVSYFVHVLGLLKILADGNYRGHLECPCRSGSNVRNCHGEDLRRFARLQSPDRFSEEVESIIDRLSKEQQGDLRLEDLPKKIQKRLQKVALKEWPRKAGYKLMSERRS